MADDAVTIVQADIDAYARVSGDFNPIHVDPAFAKTTAYGTTIAHGTVSSAIITRRLLRDIGPHHIVRRLSLRFVGPIRSGDTLRAHIDEVPASGAAATDDRTFKVSTSNQANETVAVGEAHVTKRKS